FFLRRAAGRLRLPVALRLSRLGAQRRHHQPEGRLSPWHRSPRRSSHGPRRVSTTRSINTNVSAPAAFAAPVPLVALAEWILPGAGYFLIGQITRGVVVVVTILAMFVF